MKSPAPMSMVPTGGDVRWAASSSAVVGWTSGIVTRLSWFSRDMLLVKVVTKG